MLLHAESPDHLGLVYEAVSKLLTQDYRIFLLEGEMGSGKTTLVKYLCEQWGVMEPVSSPTFSIIQEYESPGQGTISHMDLYRLDKPEDLQQIGFEDYLYSGNICLIEWPALAKSYIAMPHVLVEITVATDNIRNFKITTHDAVDA